MQEQTSIRISTKLLEAIKKFKEQNETYEDVLWDFIEPHLELSPQAKKDIKKSENEYKKGDFSTLEEVKKDLGF